MDCMKLLKLIHHILNLWVDDETHSLWYMQIKKNDTGSNSPWSYYWHPTSIDKSQTKPIPKISLFSDMTIRFVSLHWLVDEQHTHIHWDYFIIGCFSWLQSLSDAERKDDIQISKSRKTKSNDLDILLCRNASSLFSQLKNERDRQEERGKTKIVILRGNKHLNYWWYAKYILSCIYKVLCFCR